SIDTTLSGNAGTVYIWVTDQNITAPVVSSFLTTLSSNQIPAGATFTEQAWLDPGNGLFTTVDQLLSNTFMPSVFGQQKTQVTHFSSGPKYSITEVYAVTLAGPGAVSGNIDVAVPGPV